MKNITSFGEILFDVYPDKKTLGGAPFNFIYHIIKLTGQGSFISRIGEDEPGREILSRLKSAGISTAFIQNDQTHPTGAANANLDENKIPHWIIEGNCAYDFIDAASDLNDLLKSKTDCLYFGTLAQRNAISKETLRSFFGRKIKYFCDLNLRQNFYNEEVLISSLENADALKLNNDELKILNSLLLKKNENEVDLIKRLSGNFNIELVCLTKGEEGAVIYMNGEISRYKVDVKNVVDTVGAGDAYASVLCIGYMEGWQLNRINKAATEFASAIVQVEGALPKDDNLYNQFKEKIKYERTKQR